MHTRKITCGLVLLAIGLTAVLSVEQTQAQVPTPAKGLLPFFDNVDNPVPVDFPKGTQQDITPTPPKLGKFDEQILALCGPGFDAPVSAQKFTQLISFYPDVVQKLQQATGGELKPNRRSNAAFVQDLTAIWFNQQGFKHIFCGEKAGKKIDGLHFVGRYWQLQQAGIAGRVVNKDTLEEVVDGEIYTFGAAIYQNGRVIAQSPIKGYPYTLNAEEILIDATKAFKQFQLPRNVSKDACLFTVNDPPAKPFQAVFVNKEGAIRTFYPDATPDSKTKPCS